MPGSTDLCHPETVRVAASHQAEAEKIAAELAAIARSGMVLPGSISVRRTRCALKAPITTPVGTGFRSINVYLRQELGLFAFV